MALLSRVRRPSPREVKSFVLYLIDWMFVGGTALVAYAFGSLKPNMRPFALDDPNISFPYQTKAKIPTWLLSIISLFLPALTIAASIFWTHRHKTNKQRVWLLNNAWLGLGVSLASAMLVTNAMKNLLGKPRPDLLSRCIPDRDRIDSGDYFYGQSMLAKPEICRSFYGAAGPNYMTKDDLQDGFRSFLSGHASISFSGLTYLTIFLTCHYLWALKPRHNGAPSKAVLIHSQASLLRPTNHPSAPLLLILAVPVLIAVYVGTTRYSDFRHHGVDVLLGGLLGIGVAMLGWSWYGSRSVNGTRGFGGLSVYHGRRPGEYDLESGFRPPVIGNVMPMPVAHDSTTQSFNGTSTAAVTDTDTIRHATDVSDIGDARLPPSGLPLRDMRSVTTATTATSTETSLTTETTSTGSLDNSGTGIVEGHSRSGRTVGSSSLTTESGVRRQK